MAEPLSAHVVIVGAGVAGMLAAYRLAQAGVQVLVLEAGPAVIRSDALATFRQAVAKTPDAPYPTTTFFMPRGPKSRICKAIMCRPGQSSSRAPMNAASAAPPGTGSAPHCAICPTISASAPRYNIALDWPLSYDELEPWYLEAEQELGVAGDSSQDLGSPRSGAYPMKALPLTYLDKQVALAANKLGLDVYVTPQARNSRL